MESLYGQDNLDVAIILNSLGNTAKAQGEPAEALAFFARALGIFRDNLSENILILKLQKSIWMRFNKHHCPRKSWIMMITSFAFNIFIEY